MKTVENETSSDESNFEIVIFAGSLSLRPTRGESSRWIRMPSHETRSRYKRFDVRVRDFTRTANTFEFQTVANNRLRRRGARIQ